MEILRQRRLPDAKKNHFLFRRNFHEFLRNLNNKIYAVLLNDQTQMCPLFNIFKKINTNFRAFLAPEEGCLD